MPRGAIAGGDHAVKQHHAIPPVAPVARGMLLHLLQEQTEFSLSIVVRDRRHRMSSRKTGPMNEPEPREVQYARVMPIILDRIAHPPHAPPIPAAPTFW